MPLFTAAEARAFDKGQLADAAAYSAAAIEAKEAEVRELFEQACGVRFVSATTTDEYHSGDGTPELLLDWPLVTSVTAASQRSDTTWTALTATELAELQVSSTGMVYWDGGAWESGTRNIKVTYTSGHASVPALIKRAALLIAVTELPATNVPFAAESYDAGGIAVSYAAGDGFNDAWHRIPEVRRALRLYNRRLPGIV